MNSKYIPKGITCLDVEIFTDVIDNVKDVWIDNYYGSVIMKDDFRIGITSFEATKEIYHIWKEHLRVKELKSINEKLDILSKQIKKLTENLPRKK